MKYLTAKELSEKWKITRCRVVVLAREGRIKGAKLYGKSWIFPENAQKPIDGRTKAGKTENQREQSPFRCPFFEFKDASTFDPPLNEEELTIKAVVEEVNACRFTDAETLLGDLPERAQNRYIRIASLYCGCMIDMFFCDTERFLNRYAKLKAELQEDFPHKAEMCEYIHQIDASLGADEYYSNEFHNIPAMDLHESFLPRLCSLSALHLAFGNRKMTPADLTAHEANYAFLEKTDNYFDLQAMHTYLACAYSMLNKDQECHYHFTKALDLAEKYEMFYVIAAMQYYYTPKALDEALSGFSDEFKTKIKKINRDLHQCFIAFSNALQVNSLYKMLTGDDYIYIVFAVQRLSNKQIAEQMHISVGTVGNRYSKIYDLLGVKNKKELTELYHNLTKKP